MEPQSEGVKMGIAFALVVLAGLCAPLGACCVLFMKHSHMRLLSGSIALAAGVMLFISLTEVLNESMEDIEQGAWSHTAALAIAYAFFFIGVLLCKGLDLLAASTMHWVARFNSRRKLHSASGSGSGATIAHSAASSSGDLRQCDDAAAADAAPPGGRSAYNLMHSSEADGSSVHVGAGKAAGPARPSTVQALDIETGASGTAKALAVAVPSAHKAGAAAGERKAGQSHHDLVAAGVPVEAVDRAVMDAAAGLADADMCALGRTCVLVWLALTLHNLPEGLATFVGYMSSPNLGISVAVAVAIHNIPEGIALGVPIFFKTGSRWKAIGWAAASGLAEPLGALIGLACQLAGALNAAAIGIIMAVVAGVMTGVALQELLPRALSFDTTQRTTMLGLFSGMSIMAVSLVLLSLLEPAA